MKPTKPSGLKVFELGVRGLTRRGEVWLLDGKYVAWGWEQSYKRLGGWANFIPARSRVEDYVEGVE